MTEAVLRLAALAKTFDSKPVLAGVSADVHRGEVIGLLGLNGAGKTTLLETALGFSLPSSGAALLFGQSSSTMDGASKARIGFVPQRDELLDSLAGGSYLSLIAGFYPRWNHALVARLASSWAVPLDSRISKLSVGQRQKLSIISALGHEPDLIILDEPVASLDPVARRQFLQELVDIASSQTRTILFSTHIVSDLERIASRVWLLQAGALALDASMDDLKENIVRVLLPAGRELPAMLPPQALLRRRSNGTGTSVLLRDWQRLVESGIVADFGNDVHIEALSLEDLFLELHG